MKLATVRTATGTSAGRLDGEEFVLLDAPDVGAALALGGDLLAPGPRVPAVGAELAPVVPGPGKIVCLGLNYEKHIREMGREIPGYPTMFAKFAEALVGPRDPIVLPTASRQVDWEAELAFVIGRSVRRARGSEARDAIAGYTIMNDVSARDWQWRSPQWLSGKTFERTTPPGPWLVGPDEVDHARDLRVTCRVDGEVMQDARTSDLVFDPAAIVAYVSEILTLHPGDVIATGTPGGVGAGRDPKVFLRAGQVVVTQIDGLGELVNECIAETEAENEGGANHA